MKSRRLRQDRYMCCPGYGIAGSFRWRADFRGRNEYPSRALADERTVSLDSLTVHGLIERCNSPSFSQDHPAYRSVFLSRPIQRSSSICLVLASFGRRSTMSPTILSVCALASDYGTANVHYCDLSGSYARESALYSRIQTAKSCMCSPQRTRNPRLPCDSSEALELK